MTRKKSVTVPHTELGAPWTNRYEAHRYEYGSQDSEETRFTGLEEVVLLQDLLPLGAVLWLLSSRTIPFCEHLSLPRWLMTLLCRESRNPGQFLEPNLKGSCLMDLDIAIEVDSSRRFRIIALSYVWSNKNGWRTSNRCSLNQCLVLRCSYISLENQLIAGPLITARTPTISSMSFAAFRSISRPLLILSL